MNADAGRTPPFSTFKAAWRQLIDAVGGGTQAERFTRVNKARLSNYGQIHEPSFAPADDLYRVEKAVVDAGGDPAFLIAYADALGFAVVRKETLANPLPVLDTAAVEAIGAMGQMATAFYEAARDGVITPREAEGLAVVGQKAGAEICEFTEAAKARAARGSR
jgi:hypothetical protein